jgi:hypothetical protein
MPFAASALPPGGASGSLPIPLGAAIPSVHGGGAMPDHIEASDLRKFMLGQHKLQEHQEAHL